MSFLKGNAPCKQRADQDPAAHPPGVPCAPCRSLPPCNGLKVPVPQIPVLKSLPQHHGVGRRGLWEVTRLLSSLGGAWDTAVYALRGTEQQRESCLARTLYKWIIGAVLLRPGVFTPRRVSALTQVVAGSRAQLLHLHCYAATHRVVGPRLFIPAAVEGRHGLGSSLRPSPIGLL